jgi:hypothetical protein
MEERIKEISPPDRRTGGVVGPRTMVQNSGTKISKIFGMILFWLKFLFFKLFFNEFSYILFKFDQFYSKFRYIGTLR